MGTTNGRRGLTVVLGMALSFGTTSAAPPDSEKNPVTGNIETVGQINEAANENIRHVTDPGPGPGRVSVLTNNPADDLDPRITITPDGDSWVLWWRDGETEGVFFRRFDLSESSWTTEVRISESAENSSRPEVANDGTDVWVSFEVANGPDTEVCITGGGHDDPSPFPTRTLVATTSYGGDVDVTVDAESGALWVTWVDSETEVGWSEYDYTSETWSIPDIESYASDTVADARERIRVTVLGN